MDRVRAPLDNSAFCLIFPLKMCRSDKVCSSWSLGKSYLWDRNEKRQKKPKLMPFMTMQNRQFSTSGHFAPRLPDDVSAAETVEWCSHLSKAIGNPFQGHHEFHGRFSFFSVRENLEEREEKHASGEFHGRWFTPLIRDTIFTRYGAPGHSIMRHIKNLLGPCITLYSSTMIFFNIFL